jgi:predicted metal-dependent phosphotriesterase family hydrolase
MAAWIETVLGPIDPEALGVTDAHEHVYIGRSYATEHHPEWLLDDVERAVREVELWREAGGRALVDAMPLGCGRSVCRLRDIARRTEVHIVAVTGFHKEGLYPPGHWIYRYSTEQIADLLTAEATEGMDEHAYAGPIVERTPARPGALKVASEYHHISAVEQKLFEAAAIAHLRTGVPITTHTEHGTALLEQIELLGRCGVPSRHIMLAHVDRNPDLGYHREVAATGCYLVYDGASRVKYHPDSALVDLIVRMVASGFGEQILLGQDLAARSSRASYGGGPGLGYMLTRYVPRLREAGLDEAAVRRILVENPARALTYAVYGTAAGTAHRSTSSRAAASGEPA